MRLLASIVVLLVACGDDAPTANPTAPAPAGTPQPAAAAPAVPGAGSGKPLPVMRLAEDRVICPVPTAGNKKCDPTAIKPPEGSAAPDLTCGENELCMNTTEGYMCSRCEERFRIRREFRDGENGDFNADFNRDPFQSYVVKVVGTGNGASPGDTPDTGGKCGRADQLRVVNYGYQDLKLVGIVTQGTQRKVLLMDPGNKGHIVKSGDCVGKEKAWVKSIGDNFICFEPADASIAARTPEDCKELHNKQFTVSELPSSGSAPVAPAGGTPSPVPAPTGGPTTTIVPARPAQEQLVPVPQPSRDAPVNLKP